MMNDRTLFSTHLFFPINKMKIQSKPLSLRSAIFRKTQFIKRGLDHDARITNHDARIINANPRKMQQEHKHRDGGLRN